MNTLALLIATSLSFSYLASALAAPAERSQSFECGVVQGLGVASNTLRFAVQPNVSSKREMWAAYLVYKQRIAGMQMALEGLADSDNSVYLKPELIRLTEELTEASINFSSNGRPVETTDWRQEFENLASFTEGFHTRVLALTNKFCMQP